MDTGNNGERKAYNVDEVGKMLGIGRSSAYTAVRTGQIRSIKVGRRIIIPASALDRLLNCPDDNHQPPAPSPGGR